MLMVSLLNLLNHSISGRVFGDRIIERSGDVVCGLHRAQGNVERMFLGLDSTSWSTVSPDLASKPVAMVLVVWPQNHSLRSPVWVSKPAAAVW
jgi:hypothetical protein